MAVSEGAGKPRVDNRPPAGNIQAVMKADDFWSLIRHSRSDLADTDDGSALVALTTALTELNRNEIAVFDARFREEVERLDRPDLRDVADQLWVLSEDDWLHLRAWCVSRGAEFISRMEQRPAVLRSVATPDGCPFDAPSGELFLCCADYARVTREVTVAS